MRVEHTQVCGCRSSNLGEQEVRILGLMRAVLLACEHCWGGREVGGHPDRILGSGFRGKQIKEGAVNLESNWGSP